MILQISTLPPEFPFHPLLILKPLIAAFSRHALPPTCVPIFYNPFFYFSTIEFPLPGEGWLLPGPGPVRQVLRLLRRRGRGGLVPGRDGLQPQL